MSAKKCWKLIGILLKLSIYLRCGIQIDWSEEKFHEDGAFAIIEAIFYTYKYVADGYILIFRTFQRWRK